MPFHICHEEIFLIVSSLPIAGYFWAKLRCKLGARGHEHCNVQKLQKNHKQIPD